MKRHLGLALCFLTAAFLCSVARAQHSGHDTAPASGQPTKESSSAGERVGDPYPLGTCPVTGKKLGTMGDPVIKLYSGREVRFCCSACPPKFEKNLPVAQAKLDEKITKDQSPIYPLKTSVVTGKDLPEQPFEFVHGNRLVRVGAQAEQAEFLKSPQKYLAELDKAVVAAQSKAYALKTCPVSSKELGANGSEPVDMVVAGRLIRLCCKDCRKDVEENPAKFIAEADAARREASKPAAEPAEHADHPDHK